MSIYERIGATRLQAILNDFYLRCFEDVMIGHFFFEKDHDELLKHQLAFTAAMLGGPNQYEGRPVALIHKPLSIRLAQFMRRRVILREAMAEHGLEPDIIEAWLKIEDRLRSLVLIDDSAC
jgi:hemoglobin